MKYAKDSNFSDGFYTKPLIFDNDADNKNVFIRPRNDPHECYELDAESFISAASRVLGIEFNDLLALYEKKGQPMTPTTNPPKKTKRVDFTFDERSYKTTRATICPDASVCRWRQWATPEHLCADCREKERQNDNK